MSIRRKRRQRGKAKALRRKLQKEATLTWEALIRANLPAPTKYPGVLIPIIRNVMPSVIAHDLVGVQPMQAPVGIELPEWRFSHGFEEKKAPRQRKKEKADARRERIRMEKIMRQLKEIGSRY